MSIGRRSAAELILASLLILFALHGCSKQDTIGTDARDPPDSVDSVFTKIPEIGGHKSFRISSDSPLYAPYADEKEIAWTRNKPRPQILIRTSDEKERVAYEISDKKKSWFIMPVLIDGDILVWSEYYQSGDAGPVVWSLCWKRIDHPAEKVTIAGNGANFQVQPRSSLSLAGRSPMTGYSSASRASRELRSRSMIRPRGRYSRRSQAMRRTTIGHRYSGTGWSTRGFQRTRAPAK